MRDQQLLIIRPKLNLSDSKSTDMEAFQNNTLRPLLKLQHDCTWQLLLNAKHFKSKIAKVDLKNTMLLHNTIKTYLSSDTILRYKIIGTIIAMMTQTELEFYFENEAEVNKRLISMQIKRYTDTYEA